MHTLEKLVAIAFLSIVELSQVSAQEYRKATELERIRAYCDEVGAQAERGHFVFGSPGFVLGAGIGAAIRRNLDHQRAFDNCMTMHGYVRTDKDETSAPPGARHVK